VANPPPRSGPNRASAFDPRQAEAPKSLGEAARYNEELGREASALEEGLELLRARYDQWFLGLERREPAREREEMRRQVARLKGVFTRNTGLRFRIQSLHARFISYERMWQRCARQKEEGTYRPDVLRARRAAERAAAAAAAAEAADGAKTGATPAGVAPLQVAAPVACATPPPAELRAVNAAPPSLTQVPGMSEVQLRALHADLVAAKRQCNEDASRLTADALARTLARQVPDLLAKTQASRVEFRVVVKDGKAILKAVPKA
jgi:hypothetical protein